MNSIKKGFWYHQDVRFRVESFRSSLVMTPPTTSNELYGREMTYVVDAPLNPNKQTNNQTSNELYNVCKQIHMHVSLYVFEHCSALRALFGTKMVITGDHRRIGQSLVICHVSAFSTRTTILGTHTYISIICRLTPIVR